MKQLKEQDGDDMTIREYVTLDSKQYRVIQEGYEQARDYPKSVERSLAGTSVVWKAPGNPWRVTPLMLMVLASDNSPWGSISDLRTSYAKTAISIVENNDSYSYTGTLMGYSEVPISPGLDTGFFVRLTLQETP